MLSDEFDKHPAKFVSERVICDINDARASEFNKHDEGAINLLVYLAYEASLLKDEGRYPSCEGYFRRHCSEVPLKG
jgi:hypothetical protein